MLFIYDNHLKHLWNWTGFQYGPPCNKPKIRSLVTIPTTSFFYANRIWKSLCLLHTRGALPNAERSAMCAVFDLFLTISSRFRFNCCWFKTKIFIPKSRRQKIVASACKAKAPRANLPLVVPCRCHTTYSVLFWDYRIKHSLLTSLMTKMFSLFICNLVIFDNEMFS